jgi:hypothetical protein
LECLYTSRTFTASLYPQPQEATREPASAVAPADGVAGLVAGDLNVIDTFFSRTLDLDLDKRAEIADRIANRMSTKMQVPLPEGVVPERMRSRSAMRCDPSQGGRAIHAVSLAVVICLGLH